MGSIVSNLLYEIDKHNNTLLKVRVTCLCPTIALNSQEKSYKI